MRRVAVLMTVLAAVLAATGCGAEEPPSGGSGSTGTSVELTFEGDDAPAVQRVQVDPGEEVELVITSDTPGELHVHTEPEDEIEYSAGTTTVTLSFDQPGVVDVERHDPEALVLQVEVG